MARAFPVVMGSLILAVLVGLPLGYQSYQKQHLRNLRVVKPGVLYRSGQLSQSGLERVIHDYGIRTVVTFRDAATPGGMPPDAAEEAYCRAKAIRHVRIPARRWESSDGGPAPADAGVAAFLAVMDDPANFPVLVHCFAGIHRTGAHVAIWRMEYDGWSNAEALDELRAGGYEHLDDEWDVLGYLESYRPRKWRMVPAELQ